MRWYRGIFPPSFHPPYWGWVIMAILTGVYVIVGGYMGSAINNFIQGLIMLVGIVAVIAAAIAILVVTNKEMASKLYISDLMGISWGALAGCFLAPFLYGLYWKKVTKAAVWVSFATGLGITLTQFVLNAVCKITFEYPVLAYFCGSSINAGMLAMAVGLLLVPVVSLLTQKTRPEGTEEIFACYDRMVTVPVGTALENEEK